MILQPAGLKPLPVRPLIVLAKPKQIEKRVEKSSEKQIAHVQLCKYSKCCREVETLLKEVCTKLENVKEERVVMQQMARVERWVNGHTDFAELKRLQWYDFSACPKRYLDFSKE